MTMAAADTNAQSVPLSALRVAVLLVASVCAMLWFVAARASVADALPLAKGVRLGMWTMLVFLLAVWPALILAICNVAIRLAAVLAGTAAAATLYMFVAYQPAPSGTELLTFGALLALIVLALATFWIFADHAPEKTFEQAQLRLFVLYVSGTATTLWLSCVVPLIYYTGRGSGFAVIAAFIATIPFVIVVIPLMLIGLRGKDSRHPDLLGGVTFLTLVTCLIFGVPQLLG